MEFPIFMPMKKWLFFLIPYSILFSTISLSAQRPYLQAALKTEQWLRSVRLDTERGYYWPPEPADSTATDFVTNLYSGSAGVVLFYLELYHATGEASYLEQAEGGGRFLVQSLPDTEPNSNALGLYSGLAGIGYTLQNLEKHSTDILFKEGLKRCNELLYQAARKTEEEINYWGGITDIVYGGAGIGLYLLHLSEQSGDEQALELAKNTGAQLLGSAIRDSSSLRWRMMPGYERFMPNFSHGTAGVAYFLSRLYERTGEQKFLDTALEAASFLESITNTDGLIHHHEPDGEDLFYLSWCHGPPGTARLYYMLWQLTGENKWKELILLPAEHMLTLNLPEQQTPGFWNNVGQCCGSSGLAEYYMELYRITRERKYLNFVQQLTIDLLDRATPESNGLKWIQAENRIRPEELAAQTGYMQGAAGIGLYFLRLDAYQRGRQPKIILPDSPFGF